MNVDQTNGQLYGKYAFERFLITKLIFVKNTEILWNKNEENFYDEV
jgi:hypothetical protein